jgi:histidinol-phosphate aminotransferase
MAKQDFSNLLSRRNFLKTSAGGALLLGLGSASLTSLLGKSRTLPYQGKAPLLARLNFNENPLGLSPLALKALMQDDVPYNRYVKTSALREELARFHNLKPDNILLGVGSTEILRIAPMAFASNKGNVITALQTYKTLGRYAEKIGIKVTWVPLNKQYQHDLEAMRNAIDKDTRLIYICNPNNPTGRVLPYNELEEFINALPDTIVSLVDEAYYHYIEDKEYPSAVELVKKGKKVIVPRTFSKVYGMAGLRMGYAIAPSDIIKKMENYSFDALGINIAGITAAHASLKDFAHIKKSVDLAKKGREYFYKELKAMGFECVPSQAPFLLVNIKRNCSPVVKALKKRNVLVREGKDWQIPNFVRISMGLMEENELCIKALKEALA